MKKLLTLSISAALLLSINSGCGCCNWMKPARTFVASPVVGQPACNTCPPAAAPVTYGYPPAYTP